MWLISPRWWGVCALVALVALGAGYWRGYAAADKAAELAALQGQMAQLKRDAEAARSITEEVEAARVAAAQQRDELATKLQEATRELEALPAIEVLPPPQPPEVKPGAATQTCLVAPAIRPADVVCVPRSISRRLRNARGRAP